LRTLTDIERALYAYLKRKLAAKDAIPRLLRISDMAYALHSTYWKTLNAKNGLKKKGLIEVWTVTHRNLSRGPGHFSRTSYYRLRQ
jgi:hypothetical protein